MLGILLIDKPAGISSHDVVNRLRKAFQTKRIGHAGTLDPLGTGLLVMAIGPATRFLQYLSLEPKEYVCTFRFGISTTTQDTEGETVQARTVPTDLGSCLNAALPQFLGMIEQIPPMFSAVKKDGKPLYEYARQGIEVERRIRNVHIDSIDVLDLRDDEADVRVVCSGGTYVRTLGHDLGEAIGCGAHMTSLRRTRAGVFRLEQAQTLDEAYLEHLIPLPIALSPMTIHELNQTQTAAIRQGRQIGWLNAGPGLVGLVDDSGEIVGIARAEGDFLQPECVIPVRTSDDS